MPTRSLPHNPSLVHLRKQARELQLALRAGDPRALALASDYLPDPPPSGHRAADEFPLHRAQLVLARSYGFRSWPALVDELGWVERLSRAPEVDPPDSDPAATFLLHAVLRYSPDDSAARRAVAARMLADDPAIGRSDLWTACVTADAAAVAAVLDADPAAAGRAGGVLRWEPLLYLAYARLDPPPSRADVMATAQLLLSAGADPDAGYLWHGERMPFTVLTGAFGSGEQGASDQPHHPYALELARLLLDAGADPNDGQTLYNRMFEPDDSHLELLLAYGLGTGDGGPWHRRFPDSTPAPAELIAGQLSWAITHGMAQRIRLLAGHGADLAAPLPQWATRADTPVGLALRSGRPDIARLLMELGAPGDDLDAETQLVGALLTGDADRASALATPDLLERIRHEQPSLVLRAAVNGSREGVELLLAHGFDVNAFGRQDVPVEQEWETALHHAAGEGDVELTSLLLAAGADPTLVDHRFQATPLGWAEFFGQPATAELLRRATGPTVD